MLGALGRRCLCALALFEPSTRANAHKRISSHQAESHLLHHIPVVVAHVDHEVAVHTQENDLLQAVMPKPSVALVQAVARS